MHVVGHHHERVEAHAVGMVGDGRPALVRHASGCREPHHAATDVPKKQARPRVQMVTKYQPGEA
jgi:hypothetical protein